MDCKKHAEAIRIESWKLVSPDPLKTLAEEALAEVEKLQAHLRFIADTTQEPDTKQRALLALDS